MVGRRKGRQEQKCNRGTLSVHMNADQWHFQVLKAFIPFVCFTSETSLNSVTFSHVGFEMNVTWQRVHTILLNHSHKSVLCCLDSHGRNSQVSQSVRRLVLKRMAAITIHSAAEMMYLHVKAPQTYTFRVVMTLHLKA